MNTPMSPSFSNHQALRTHQGHTPKLGKNVLVDPTAVVIGQVEIGDDSSIWP